MKFRLHQHKRDWPSGKAFTLATEDHRLKPGIWLNSSSYSFTYLFPKLLTSQRFCSCLSTVGKRRITWFDIPGVFFRHAVRGELVPVGAALFDTTFIERLTSLYNRGMADKRRDSPFAAWNESRRDNRARQVRDACAVPLSG